MKIAGIDIGGTKISGGVIENGEIISEIIKEQSEERVKSIFGLNLKKLIANNLSGKENEDHSAVFIIVFCIVWVGGVIVSMNAQFLGCRM